MSRYLSGLTMNHDFSGIHCIADAVLSISMNNNRRAVHKSPQVLPGGTINMKLGITVETTGNVSLPQNTFENDRLGSFGKRSPYLSV